MVNEVISKDMIVSDVDYMKLLFDDKFVSIFSLDTLHLGLNSGNYFISKKAALKSLPSFYNKPVYAALSNKYNPLSTNTDFLEHFRGQDHPNNVKLTDIVPFGTIPESSDAEFIERDGKVYLRVIVVVWKSLLPQISEILKKRDGSVKISIEFIIKDGYQREEDGVLVVNEFILMAVTALGAKFKEVIEGSMIKTLRFSYDEFAEKSKTDYEKYIQTVYNGEIPDVIKELKKGGFKDMTEEEKKLAAEEEAKKLAEEEMAKKCAEEEEAKKCAEEEAKKADEEAKKAEEDKKKADEEKKMAEDAEIIKNALDKLQGDYDSLSENYGNLEVKYNSLEVDFNSQKEQLSKYVRVEEALKMSELVDSFKHCFSKEDIEDLQVRLEKMSYTELEAEVNKKALEFAKSAKMVEGEDGIKKFSFNPYFKSDADFSKEEGGSPLDKIIRKSKTKII